MIPPTRDFVLLIYPAKGPISGEQLSHVTSIEEGQSMDRAADAAAAFVVYVKDHENKHES